MPAASGVAEDVPPKLLLYRPLVKPRFLFETSVVEIPDDDVRIVTGRDKLNTLAPITVFGNLTSIIGGADAHRRRMI